MRSAVASTAAVAVYNWLWRPARPFALRASRAISAAERRQRLGQIEATPLEAGAMPIWLHAASVGEIEAVRPIALGLLEQFPRAALFLTTMTRTGRDAAAARIPAARACWMAPLDHPDCVRNFLDAVAPLLVLIAETELWPNYFLQARRSGARLAIINGRMSARARRRYRLMGPLARAALDAADLVMVQSEADAERFLALGAAAQRVIVTGNTKFGPLDQPHLAPSLYRFATRGPMIVAGSTAPGEERIVIAAYLQLRAQIPDLTLTLAPRHLERCGEVGRMLDEHGLVFISAGALKADREAPDHAPVLLVDTMGDLRGLYRYGRLAFIGGSLFKGRGGQNLGEAAAAGCPVLFGPFHENQVTMADALLKCGGGSVVDGAAGLSAAAARLLGDYALAQRTGACARTAYEKMAGAVNSTLAHIRPLLERS